MRYRSIQKGGLSMRVLEITEPLNKHESKYTVKIDDEVYSYYDATLKLCNCTSCSDNWGLFGLYLPKVDYFRGDIGVTLELPLFSFQNKENLAKVIFTRAKRVREAFETRVSRCDLDFGDLK